MKAEARGGFSSQIRNIIGASRRKIALGCCLAFSTIFAAANMVLAQGTLTPGVQVTSSIGLPGGSETWNFTANAGDTVVISVGSLVLTGTNSLDPYITLYAPGGALVASIGGYGYKGEQVYYRATNSGAFSTVISAGSTAGAYRITLGRTGGAGVSGGLTNGYRASGSISIGSLDTWTFNANAGDGIIVRMGNTTTNGTLDPYFRLYDPSGALVSFVGGYGYKAEEVTTRATNSGIFTAFLTGGSFSNGGFGPYIIKLAKTGDPIVVAPGDQGGTLTNGFVQTGTIDFGDADIWSFKATNGDALYVRMGNLTTNGVLDPYLRVYDPSGAQLTYVGDYGFKAEDASLRATNAGTFTVVLSGANNGAQGVGDYRINMVKTGDPLVTAPGDEGGIMTNGYMYTGQIDLGDIDAWTVSANAGDTIIVRMGNQATTNTLDPYLRIYGPDGTLLQNVGDYGYLVEEASVRATTNGTYLVTLAGANGIVGGTGTYRIKLAQSGTPVTIAPGDEGGQLLNNNYLPGNIPFGDIDVWTYTAFAGTHPTVDVQQLSSANGFAPGLRVYSPNGVLLGSSSGTSPAVSFSPTNTGQVTIVVGDANPGPERSGTYQIRYQCGCGTNIAMLASDGTTNAFSGQLHVIPLISTNVFSMFDSTPEAIGMVTFVSGTVTITHTNQAPQQAVVNDAVYMGDVIQTGTNSAVRIMFCDDTSFSISQNTKLTIDNYVYDPDYHGSGPSFLGGIFSYVSGLIASKPDPDLLINQPMGSLGIRGDASDYINRLDVLLDPAAVMQTASPVTMYTAVVVPTNSFVMGFDYGFLQAAGTFNVAIGGIQVFADTADDYDPRCLLERVAFQVTNATILKMGLAELTFNFDGPPGIGLFVDNIDFPGLQNSDFANYDANWFSRGHGTTMLTATAHPLCSEFTQLSVTNSGSLTTLSWPLTATNYTLQASASVTGGSNSWSTVTNPVSMTTNAFSVTVTNDATQRFYRLFLQCN